MKITYAHHSGFLVELSDCCLIFDYFEKGLTHLPDKPVLVFASHAHHDHYDPVVFDLVRPELAIVSKDIPPRRRPEGVQVLPVAADRDYELPHGIRLKTLRSTDAGVAFYLETPEGFLYHAGDLNDWVWAGESPQYNRQMIGNYRREIDKLRGGPVDCAFVPLDPRQEEDYARGLLYVLKTLAPKHVFPMHYWEKPEIIDRFLREYPQYKDDVNYTERFKEGTPYEI